MKTRIHFLARLTLTALAAALLLGMGTASLQHAAASNRRPSIFQRDHQPSWWVDRDVQVDPSIHALSAGQTIPNEVIVQVKPGVSPAALAQRFGLAVKRPLLLPNTVVLAAPAGDARAKIVQLARHPAVAYAAPNAPVRMLAAPNDPFYNEQWAYPLIKAPGAWDIQKGTITSSNPGVTVAVLDTGINFNHPDLQGRIATGGFDFWNNDTDPSDDNGHGSHVSGIIAAATNNGVGVAGMTWEGVKILPVKVLDKDGNGTVDSLSNGLKFAADSGARIINMSVGAPSDNPTLKAAVQYALNAPQQPVLVCAAGNSSDRRTNPPTLGGVTYPANYPFARIIAVAAVGPDGTVAYYSSENTSPPSATQGGVDIAAPGGASNFSGDTAHMVLSTGWSATNAAAYLYAEGTSQACPFVAGTVALLLSQGVKTTDVENILYSTATRTTAGRTEALGNGVLNAQAALQTAGSTVRIVWPSRDFPSETASTLLLIRLQNASLNGLQVSVDGNSVSGGTSQTSASSIDVRYHVSLPPGSHSVSVTANSTLNGQPQTTQTTFQVAPHVLPPGFLMFSAPYFLQPGSASPGTVFGGSPYRLARYAPADQTYAFFDSTGALSDTRASFNPPSTGLADNPAGLGYWLRLADPATLFLDGDPVLDSQYRIPVSTGWAMIGDPFVFPVSLGAAQVQANGQTVSMAQAVANGWIRSTVYRYNGSGGYNALTTSAATLNPWESVWVQAKVSLVIILPGVQ